MRRIDNREMGLIIEKARLQVGLTREELADRAGCCRQSVAHYEAGDRCPDLQIAVSIARVLDIDLNKLKEVF